MNQRHEGVKGARKRIVFKANDRVSFCLTKLKSDASPPDIFDVAAASMGPPQPQLAGGRGRRRGKSAASVGPVPPQPHIYGGRSSSFSGHGHAGNINGFGGRRPTMALADPSTLPDDVRTASHTFILGREFPRDESRNVEFKLVNTRTIIPTSIKYTNAFLNSEGGVIYFGIRDDGNIQGTVFPRKLRDEIRLQLDHAFIHSNPPIDMSMYEMAFHPVWSDGPNSRPYRDVYVFMIKVKASYAGVYQTDDRKMWTRMEGSVRYLTPPMMAQRVASMMRKKDEELENKEATMREQIERMVRETMARTAPSAGSAPSGMDMTESEPGSEAPKSSGSGNTAADKVSQPEVSTSSKSAVGSVSSGDNAFNDQVIHCMEGMGFPIDTVLKALYDLRKCGEPACTLDDIGRVMDRMYSEYPVETLGRPEEPEEVEGDPQPEDDLADRTDWWNFSGDDEEPSGDEKQPPEQKVDLVTENMSIVNIDPDGDVEMSEACSSKQEMQPPSISSGMQSQSSNDVSNNLFKKPPTISSKPPRTSAAPPARPCFPTMSSQSSNSSSSNLFREPPISSKPPRISSAPAARPCFPTMSSQSSNSSSSNLFREPPISSKPPRISSAPCARRSFKPFVPSPAAASPCISRPVQPKLNFGRVSPSRQPLTQPSQSSRDSVDRDMIQVPAKTRLYDYLVNFTAEHDLPYTEKEQPKYSTARTGGPDYAPEWAGAVGFSLQGSQRNYNTNGRFISKRRAEEMAAETALGFLEQGDDRQSNVEGFRHMIQPDPSAPPPAAPADPSNPIPIPIDLDSTELLPCEFCTLLIPRPELELHMKECRRSIAQQRHQLDAFAKLRAEKHVSSSSSDKSPSKVQVSQRIPGQFPQVKPLQPPGNGQNNIPGASPSRAIDLLSPDKVVPANIPGAKPERRIEIDLTSPFYVDSKSNQNKPSGSQSSGPSQSSGHNLMDEGQNPDSGFEDIDVDSSSSGNSGCESPAKRSKLSDEFELPDRDENWDPLDPV
eukprot:168303_1